MRRPRGPGGRFLTGAEREAGAMIPDITHSEQPQASTSSSASSGVIEYPELDALAHYPPPPQMPYLPIDQQHPYYTDLETDLYTLPGDGEEMRKRTEGLIAYGHRPVNN